MSDSRVRADAAVYAQRVNAAAELLESGVPVVEAAAILAQRFGCSVRQARRYADRATESGRVLVPEETTVFTVKLPAALAVRVRQHARESGSTISALVARALTEFLARGHRKPRGR
ncbi:ribbon-helix-helix protein, CopG family [Rhodococcus aetherivorans]|uniref:ribbon-helix-helix protein, CopG family n=1 Tax=Rhodococcus aetherivorans TaxID=191292 RepID=UPI00163AC8F4|nr:ribbon-helix-helix protein, CopG family [Rhodococcus aetherivorans]MBC2586875.1 ribbon-helix-helix protein, CopG family [Rhodococcus aetherivorans]